MSPNLQLFKTNLKERVLFRTNLQVNHKLVLPYELSEIQQQFVNALWRAYINNEGALSTPYWFDKFNNPRDFNQFLKLLSDNNWIHSTVVQGRHWAEVSLKEDKLLDYLTKDELIAIRRDNKFEKYRMRCDTVQHSGRLTKINGNIKDTGLVRYGFAKAGTNKFKYDTNMLAKYYDSIVLNVTKSMCKIAEIHTLIEDGADYKSIATSIVDFHLYSKESSFTLGRNYNDSRGRAISSALQKVFNPIGFKDARALLIIDDKFYVTDDNREDTVYAICLFIAELYGVKQADSEQHKADMGWDLYEARKLPSLDLDNEEDRKDLHELIWLERLYNELDNIFLAEDNNIKYLIKVPLELDAGASMLQLTGALLNDEKLLAMTNCIEGHITDPWYVPNLSREQVKKSATPMLYGSSATPRDLWTKNKLKFTAKQAGIMNYELSSGKYSIANDFKNMIISNVQPTEIMNVIVDGQEFTIECNRYKRIGDYTKRYPIYSTDTNSVQAIAHTHTKSVPDLKQFVRYFQTLLV